MSSTKEAELPKKPCFSSKLKCAYCYIHKSQAPDRKFFSFPANEAMCKKWVSLCNRPYLLSKSITQLHQSYKICSDHFLTSDFLPPKMYRLKPSAYPTFNLIIILRLLYIKRNMTETENKATQKDKKRIVKALFSYTPINSDELQLKINDVLEVIEETEEGWWKGVLNGNVGMFPSNFVAEHYSEASSNQTTNEMSPTKLPAKVKNVDLQDGTKHDSTHSSSSKPDNIKTIINNLNSNSDDKIDDKPKISDTLDRKGSASKKNTVDSAAPRLPPKPVREQARVIYPYTALNEDELSLKEGDIITVISKEVEDKGWWKGELNNRTGVFPDNFVQLIKVEEQKKPERPDKPSAAFTSKANLKSSDKASSSEFSPKADKRVLKVPPVKPPPPEIHKKEIDRPSPPFPSKKPQVPHPMKKPSRSSLGSKFSGFTSPALAKPLIPETTHVAAPIPLATETKPIPPGATETKPEVPKNAEKFSEKEEKSKNQDIGFEGLELSGKKLVHLTANRVKAPNRRPPSHVFLRESEKENGFSPDSRRLSEPLLSEMKSMLNLVDTDFHKPNVSGSSEGKTARIPPSRPLPPSLKASKPTVQGSIVLTKTISSEECIVKAPEPIKKAILPDNSIVPVSEFLQPKKTDLAPSVNLKFLKSGDNELQELKESIKSVMCTMVSQKEFNELSKQMQMPPNKVKDLKESLEKCSIHCNELKNELESEKRLRESLEIELHQIKEHQTT